MSHGPRRARGFQGRLGSLGLGPLGVGPLGLRPLGLGPLGQLAVGALVCGMGCAADSGADDGGGFGGAVSTGGDGPRPATGGRDASDGGGPSEGSGGSSEGSGGSIGGSGGSSSGGGRGGSSSGGSAGGTSGGGRTGGGGSSGGGSDGDGGNTSGGRTGGGGSGGRTGGGGGGNDGSGGGTSGGGSGGNGGEPPRVELIDGVLHAGVQCLLVRTETADYYYDKEGAGLASLVDVSGNDWVSWSHAANHEGEFRGVPNMGPCCHPGYVGAHTSVLAEGDDHVTVRSAAEDDSWELRWDFFPDHARMTVTRAPSAYYLLYEGTPGGSLGSEDHLGFADGRLVPLTDADFLGDLPDPEWVYFLDAGVGRALLVFHPTGDDITDTYWTYDTMTVFGFGRTCRGGCPRLTRTGDVLVLALTDQTDAEDVTALATRLAEGDAAPAP